MSDMNKRNGRKRVSTEDMKEFLAGLGMPSNPTLHINGSDHRGAILTVDFGEALVPARPNNDQMHELVSNMRSLARDILGRDASISINTDNPRGILYASVS
jgi:hypothetical protein